MQRLNTQFEQQGSRLARRCVVALFSGAFLAFLSWGPRDASASCGDYLSHSHMMSHGVLPPGSGRAAPMDTSGHRRPCHGPSCQQSPMGLPFSTPSIPVETHDRWLLLVPAFEPATQELTSLARFDEPVTLPMIAFRLDRPPKA